MASPLRTLIVEDSPTDATLLVHELRRCGFDPIWHRVQTREEYLDRLGDPIDLVLADYTLPQFDAPEALRLLQERGLDVPFIVVTGTVGEDAAVACMKLGAADYLLKDRLGRLGPAIQHALEQRGLRVEQQRARAALSASEERWVRAFRASPAALSISRLRDGCFVEVNDGFCTLLGLPREQIVGRTSLELGMWVDHEVRPNVTSELSERGALHNLEVKMRDAQGHLRDVLTSLELIDLDGERAILGMAVDITAQRRREEERVELARTQAARQAAEAAHARSALLAEASRVLASSLDYEVTLPRVAALTIPGFADVCLIDILLESQQVRRTAVGPSGQLDGLVGTFPLPPDSEPGVGEALRSGRPRLLTDLGPALEWVCPQGVRVSVTGTGLDQDGQRPHAAILAPLSTRDRVFGQFVFLAVRGDRRYDEGTLALAEELADRAALAVDNARLFRTLQEALRVREVLQRQRDELSAIISHDLRTPLTAIRGWAQLGRRKLPHAMERGNVDALAEVFEQIETTTGRMATLLTELKAVEADWQDEARAYELSTLDLVALTREVVAEVQVQTDRHRIQLRAARPTMIGRWSGDRLRRVVQNLLSNAVKYSPRGGEIEVEIDVDGQGDDWVSLTVRDGGLGIPADEVDRVFEPLFRGRQVAGVIEGTGLGLAGVRHIVEQHGGEIRVQSRPGEGSTFVVRLPSAGS